MFLLILLKPLRNDSWNVWAKPNSSVKIYRKVTISRVFSKINEFYRKVHFFRRFHRNDHFLIRTRSFITGPLKTSQQEESSQGPVRVPTEAGFRAGKPLGFTAKGRRVGIRHWSRTCPPRPPPDRYQYPPTRVPTHLTRHRGLQSSCRSQPTARRCSPGFLIFKHGSAKCPGCGNLDHIPCLDS